MASNATRALCLAGTLAVTACSSSPVTPTSSMGVETGSGGNATAAGGNSSAGSDVVGTGGDSAGTAGAATGGGGTESGGTESAPDGSTTVADGGGCGAVLGQHASEGALHATLCSPLVYHTNPPSSGNHYPIWAVYKTYTKTFPRGFWVHNLEHGAVVITYNCPDGCPAEVKAAQDLIDTLPADPLCPKQRIVMLPDPDLDVRFAASAWNQGPNGAADAQGFTLRASCFDRAPFAKFIADHYGLGLEPVCDDGYDPLTAGMGGTPICP